jgi:3-methyladenine DNA glycosylase/8-oxoguanine DNA glycosylase
MRAVIGQHVSVEAATTVCRRLVRRCGRRISDGHSHSHLFPRPEAVLDADLDGLGLPSRRAATLRAVARAAIEHPEWLRLGPDLDTRIDQWRQLPGIGEWTAQILAMRALRDPDAFPATDLGVRKALASRGHLCPGGRARQRARRWRPFRAYATALLWEKPESRALAKGRS